MANRQMIYLAMLVLIQVSSRHGTNLYPPEMEQQILSSPEQIADRIYGSKIVIGLEQCMLFLTWGVKTCMMALFWKLTKNLKWLHLYVKILVGYVVLGFVVTMVCYYAVYCRYVLLIWRHNTYRLDRSKTTGPSTRRTCNARHINTIPSHKPRSTSLPTLPCSPFRFHSL